MPARESADFKGRLKDAFTDLNILDVSLKWELVRPTIFGDEKPYDQLVIRMDEEFVENFVEFVEEMAEIERETEKFMSKQKHKDTYSEEEILEMENTDEIPSD